MYSPSPQVSFFRNSIYRIYLEENFIFSLKYFKCICECVYVSGCVPLLHYTCRGQRGASHPLELKCQQVSHMGAGKKTQVL